ncbi:MAG: GntR family transcriptional regulator [Lachnospiraceae bacterium]
MNEENHSLGQQVFHKIREDILSGTYKKEEELKEKTIGEELGVSRTPVREALRQLELEGLVSIIPNKGAYVVGFTVEDIKDIYEIRTVLEGLCAKRAATRATQKQLEELEEILYLSEFHTQKGHIEQLVELDTRFHEILYEACASKVLEHALRDYHHYLERVRKVTLASEKRSVESNKEHKQILVAVKEQDEKKAEACATLHMINTIHNIDFYGWEEIVNYPKM